MRELLTTLPKNFLAAFRGKYIFYHLTAILVTMVIVFSGFDWWYFVVARKDLLDDVLFPAIVLGAILPILIPLLIIIGGWINKNKNMSITGWAIGQAGLLGFIVSALYKSITNRLPPTFDITTDISHGFQFGFLKLSVFWGWPSSHTTVAFAMAACLTHLYPKRTELKYFVLLYAIYIGIGVSTSIHWFSEFAAGAIIGSVIGTVVGKNFKEYLKR